MVLVFCIQYLFIFRKSLHLRALLLYLQLSEALKKTKMKGNQNQICTTRLAVIRFIYLFSMEDYITIVNREITELVFQQATFYLGNGLCNHSAFRYFNLKNDKTLIMRLNYYYDYDYYCYTGLTEPVQVCHCALQFPCQSCRWR